MTSAFFATICAFMHKDNWDDLRFVLAVAESESVSAAARKLGVNHATVLRRVSAFEDRYGIMVFERTATGYLVPRERQSIVEAAKAVEAAHMAVTRLVSGVRAPLTGAVRVTATDTISQAILPKALMRLRVEAPELYIDARCSNGHVDLAKVEADIALRPSQEIPEDLYGEIAAHAGFAAFAPAHDPDISHWLGLSGILSTTPVNGWMKDLTSDRNIVGKADSFAVLRQMVISGLGCSLLPIFICDGDPRLVRLNITLPDYLLPIWVVSHADLADSPRIAAVRERLTTALREDSGRIRGW